MNTTTDLDALLAPISAQRPCGEDLEYTSEFAALQIAAAGKPEQQVGELVVAAEAPDWHDVHERCVALLRRTHDLRVACRLAQAGLQVDGLAGLAAGLSLVRAYLESYWDTLYPQLDPEDGLDPAIRVNALALLCNVGAIVRPLRDKALLQSQLVGAISLRAIAIAHGAEAAPADAQAVSLAEIDAAFDALSTPQLQALADTARQARRDAIAIENELALQVGAARALDFDALTRALAEAEAATAPALTRRLDAEAAAQAGDDDDVDIAALLAGLSAATAAPPAPSASAETAQAPVPAPLAAAAVPARPAALHSRNDVQWALDALSRYFEEHEPCHPMPLLLERARRWIAMDYLAVLRDLAPDAAEQAEKLRGTSA